MPQYFTKKTGENIAYMQHHGTEDLPSVVFLSGFKSNMEGSKALALDAWCRAQNIRYTRFDYRGHGASDGVFANGCISDWLEDTLDILDHIVQTPCIMVGSSMGGWLAMLAAILRPQMVRGLIGIAPAPDFTERLVWQQLSDAQQQQMLREGSISLPSCYGDEDYVITRHLVEDGRKHLITGRPIPIISSVRLIHGMRDKDVPYQMSAEIAEQLTSDDVQITLIKDAGHRLSEPRDLEILCANLAGLLSMFAG